MRWLPLRRRAEAKGYMRAGTDHCEGGCAASFDIGSGSDEDEGVGHLGIAASEALAASALPRRTHGASSVYVRPAASSSLAMTLNVIVPDGVGGGVNSMHLAMPSGSHIVIKLDEGVAPGVAMQLQLDGPQLAALSASDIVALRDGRYSVEAGE